MLMHYSLGSQISLDATTSDSTQCGVAQEAVKHEHEIGTLWSAEAEACTDADTSFYFISMIKTLTVSP